MRCQTDRLSRTGASLAPLIDLAARVGVNPLLTHGSAGNCSCKLGSTLWIKASGQWMANARRPGFFVPLDLGEVREWVASGLDPAERCAGASVETSTHAVLPHPVVLHVHSVNTIAWAVRSDGPDRIGRLLRGLDWCWIPYVSSGLPLALAVREASAASPRAGIFVLSNHGLVIAGRDSAEVRRLLSLVEARLELHPRTSDPADYEALASFMASGEWDLPADLTIHSLATDPVSLAILAGGVMFPAQTILAHFRGGETYRPVPPSDFRPAGRRTVLLVKGAGSLFSREISPAEKAMLGSLAQVVRRIPAAAPVRYLTQGELDEGLLETVRRYRDLANANRPEPETTAFCAGEFA